MAINQSVDPRASTVQRANEVAELRDLDDRREQRTGFALAAVEFVWRTYEVGILCGERFIATGYCCFMGPKTAITIAEVVDWAEEESVKKGGTTAVQTRRGMAPYTVRERAKHGRMVVIEVGEINDRHVSKIWISIKIRRRRPTWAQMFTPLPSQTSVRYRMVPFVGGSRSPF